MSPGGRKAGCVTIGVAACSMFCRTASSVPSAPPADAVAGNSSNRCSCSFVACPIQQGGAKRSVGPRPAAWSRPTPRAWEYIQAAATCSLREPGFCPATARSSHPDAALVKAALESRAADAVEDLQSTSRSVSWCRCQTRTPRACCRQLEFVEHGHEPPDVLVQPTHHGRRMRPRRLLGRVAANAVERRLVHSPGRASLLVGNLHATWGNVVEK